jgi:hypothetical protein
MDLLFFIAFFALIAGIAVYSLITHYATSRKATGLLMLFAIIISVPLLGLGVYTIVSGSYKAETNMWAMGTCAMLAGFWLKNPLKDFTQN